MIIDSTKRSEIVRALQRPTRRVRNIARRFNVSTPTIYRIAREEHLNLSGRQAEQRQLDLGAPEAKPAAKVVRTRKRLTDETKAAIIAALQRPDASVESIALEVGVSTWTIYDFLRQRGLPSPRAQKKTNQTTKGEHMNGKHIDPALKAQALRDLASDEISVAEISNRTGIAVPTLYGWAKKAGIDRNGVRGSYNKSPKASPAPAPAATSSNGSAAKSEQQLPDRVELSEAQKALAIDALKNGSLSVKAIAEALGVPMREIHIIGLGMVG